MRRIHFILVFCFSIFTGIAISQTISTSPQSVLKNISSCKDSVTIPLKIYNKGLSLLTGTISPGVTPGPNIIMEDDFDPAIDMTYWTSSSDAAGNSCGSNSGSNALYFNSSLERTAITKDFDVLAGVNIDFYIKIGSGVSPCEMADPGENVVLEYSTNSGTTWTLINTYTTGSYNSFTHITQAVPALAKTVATRFRWRQLTHSGVGYDNWTLDDVKIIGNQKVTPWCKLTPAAFSVVAGDSASISVKLSSANMNAGTYKTDITFTSNDPLHPTFIVPCTLIVSGTAVIYLPKTTFAFGTIQQNTTKTDTIQILNNGCDSLVISDITSSLPEYTVNKKSFVVYPGKSTKVAITFAPKVVSVFNSTLTIFSNDGNKTVALTGTGEGAPVITFPKSSITGTTTVCGDSVTIPLKIKNTGLGSLSFQVDGKSSSTAKILILTNSIDPLQEYPNTLKAMGQYFSNYTTTELTTTDPVQFQNALVGKDILLVPEAEAASQGTLFLSFATAINNFVTNGGSVVFCGTSDLNKIVSSGLFSCSGTYYGTSGVTMTIVDKTHPVTSMLTTVIGQNATTCYNFTNTDKKTLINYLGYDMYVYRNIGKGKAVFIGYDYYAYDSSAAKIISYTMKWLYQSSNTIPSWLHLKTLAGTVAAGDSIDFNVTLSSKGLNTGTYKTNITFTSNDPLHPTYIVPCTLGVSGSPKIYLPKTTFAFGTVQQNLTKTDTLQIFNNGCDSLVVSNITSSLPEYTVNKKSFVVYPGQSTKVAIAFVPKVVDIFNSTLTIFSNDGNKTVALTGTGEGAPVITFPKNSIAGTTTACDDSVTIPFKIKNKGLGTLTFQVDGKSSSTAKILILTNSIDPLQEYPNTLKAMKQYFSNYTTTELTTTDPMQFQSALVGKDILLVPEAEAASQGTLFLSFATAINNFVTNGGSVVFCGTSDLNKIVSSGLFSCSGTYYSTSGVTMTIVDKTHPVTSMLTTVIGQNATMCYNFTNTDKKTLINYVGYDMLVYRNIGKGKAVYIGYDYYAYDSSAAKIISYTMKWLSQSSNAIPSWIHLKSISGTIAAGDSINYNITLSSKGLNAGLYKGNIVFKSNDPLSPEDTIAVSYNHIGAPKIKLSKTTVNFGPVMQYATKKDSVYLINTGCDTLNIAGFTSTMTEFTAAITPSNILPGDTGKLTITFSPKVIDFFNAKLTIKSNSKDTSVSLSATSTGAPVLSVTPASLTATSSACKDSALVPFTIKNTGLVPLNFSVSGGGAITYDKTSTLYYTTDGETTNHSFSGIPSGSDSITITVTLNGDYTSTGTEYANLIIEGTDYGQINLTGFPDGTDFVRTYKFSGSTIASWLTDGILEVSIKNCSSVNIGYGLQMHKVRVQSNGVGWLILNPSTNVIAAGSSSTEYVKFKNTGLANGIHAYNLVIYSNDPAHPALIVPCTYDVQTTPCTDFSFTVQSYGGMVDFTDLSAGSPSSWVWNFGDGSSSNLQNPQHAYTVAGTYHVSLTTSNPSGSSTITKTVIITNISTSFKMCSAMSSSLSSGKIFDSGGDTQNYSNYESCSFLISVPGATSITLTFKSFYTEYSYDYLRVYDGSSTSGSLLLTQSGSIIPMAVTAHSGSMYITFSSNSYTTYSGFEADWSSIKPNMLPAAAFTTTYLDQSQGLVQFTDASLYSPTSWSWNFGDGTTSTVKNPYKIYANSGVYTVVLTATNAYGTSSTTKVVTISKTQANLPVPAFTYKIEDYNQGIVSFADQTTNSPTSWLWEFGDGTTSNQQNPFKVYPSKGNHTVTLTATNSFGSNSISKVVSFSVDLPQEISGGVMDVYPNPNNGKFILDLKKLNIDNNATVKIVDVYGRTIYNSIVEDISQTEMHLNLEVPAGVYFVVLNTDNKIYAAKFTVE